MLPKRYIAKAETDKLLMRGYRAIEEFRKVGQEMPPQVMLMYLIVAMDGPVLQADLSRAVKVSTSSGSRAISWLEEPRGEYGALVSTRVVQEHNRYKEVFLTSEGQRLKDNLLQALK